MEYNNWIYDGFAKVYDLSYFFNDRLFITLLPIYFQKKLPEGKASSDKSKDSIPRCTECGKTVRPDVTLYGEFLPEKAYQGSINMIGRADCLIIGGTSLEAGSAARLAHMYHGK